MNTTVEESILRDRATKLLPYNKFIRDNIRLLDILIVFVGADDVALCLDSLTIQQMLQLA
jgi:hypothetical protein